MADFNTDLNAAIKILMEGDASGLVEASKSAEVSLQSLGSQAKIMAKDLESMGLSLVPGQMRLKELGAEAEEAGPSLQQLIDKSFGLDRNMLSAAASAKVFQQALATQGVSATEAALATNTLTTATTANTVATNSLNYATSGMIQEYVRMLRAIATGQWERLPSELATAASRMGGLQTITAGTVGAFVAMAAAIGSILVPLVAVTYRMIEFSNAAKEAEFGAKFAGNIGLTRDALYGLAQDMHNTGDSIKDTSKFLAEFARLPNQTAQEVRALGMSMHDLAQAAGGPTEAMKILSRGFGDAKLNAHELQQMFPAITQAEVDAIETAQAGDNVHLRNSEVLKVLQKEINRTFENQQKLDTEVVQSHTWWSVITGDYQKASKQLEEFGRRQAEVAQGIKAEQNAAPVAPLKDIPKDKGASGSDTALDIARELSAEEETHWRESKETMLRVEIGFWSQAVAATKAGTKQHTEALTEMHRLEAQLGQKAEQDALTETRRQVAETMADDGLLKSERLASAAGMWADLINSGKLGADDLKEAQHQLNDALEKMDKEWTSFALLEQKSRQASLLAHQKDWDKELLKELNKTATDASKVDLMGLKAAVNESFKNDAFNIGLKRQNEQEVSDRREALKQLTSMEDTFVRDVLSGRMTLGQSLARMAQNAVEQEIMADLRYLTAHLLFNEAELGEDKEKYAQGWIMKRLFGQQSVLADAKTAAAGAFTKTMQALPPPLNFIAAPIAAAGAFAAVEAFGSFAVGSWNVPKDMTANIHQGEMIVPKPFADSLRENGGGLGGGGVHLHYAPTINAPQQKSLGRMLDTESRSMTDWFNARLREGALNV